MFDPNEAPTTEPTTVMAGDLVQWRRIDLAAYVDDYALSYVMRPEAGGASVTTIPTTVSGDEFRVSWTPAIAPGRWYWSSFLTRISDNARVQFEDGAMTVKPNLATDATDQRSQARRILAAIDALLEGKATDDVQSYSIADRQLTKMSISELIEWRSYYVAQVDAEDAENDRSKGRAVKNSITTRFI